jgi:hypothetical protein
MSLLKYFYEEMDCILLVKLYMKIFTTTKNNKWSKKILIIIS